MRKIQGYKLSFKTRWFLAKKFFRYGLLTVIGWEELEATLTPETHQIDIKHRIKFEFPKAKPHAGNEP